MEFSMGPSIPADHRSGGFFDRHGRVLYALLMRELSTRYGRDNIGFLWVIVEHLIFAGGVAVLWSIIRPPYEHGIKMVPFVVTGYLPLILIRQTAGYCVSSIRVNNDLLYHRMVTPLHIFISRCAIEIIGITFAFIVITSSFMITGIMAPPKTFNDMLYIYAGWSILAWMVTGFAIIFAALAEIFDFVEKFVQIVTYILIPISGAFYMISWIPPFARKYALALPFVHCFEMIRRGFFGEFVTTYYNPLYAMAWATGFTIIALLLTRFVRDRVEVL
jgi:capsular polysaccharide transport system permease protein